MVDCRTLAEQIELACLLEAAARKPGNVHPGARFHDLEFADFQRAAAVVAPILARAAELGIGRAVRDAVAATKDVCNTNVNLGICLLLAPIAAVTDPLTLRPDVAQLIEQTTIADAEAVYDAIRSAHPGGLGEVDDQDVSQRPSVTLLAAMELAEERDAIAREWAVRFRGIDRDGAMWLRAAWDDAILPKARVWNDRSGLPYRPWEVAVIAVHLQYLALGDTLILRKCGIDLFEESRSRAHSALAAGGWTTQAGWTAIHELDDWLRDDGHRRNPGACADLVAASLFWAIRKGWILPPDRMEILQHAEQIAAARR